MKDAVATMGDVLPQEMTGRDAVHVAVIAVTAAGNVWAGGDVGVQLTDDGWIASRNLTPHIGIADPFIKKSIEDGQKFWLFLYPRTITSLAHAWTHPAFPEKDPQPGAKARAEQWMREFIASANCPDYDMMMSVIKKIADGQDHGALGEDEDYCYYRLEDDYLHFNGMDAGGEIPPEFWDHASTMTGKTIKGARPPYFSCSC
jgi:hypothetical protein